MKDDGGGSRRKYDPELPELAPLYRTNSPEDENHLNPGEKPKKKPSRMECIHKTRLFTDIKTPYTLDGRIDMEAFKKMVDFQIKNGVQGLVVGDTTGEGHLMYFEELNRSLQHPAHSFIWCHYTFNVICLPISPSRVSFSITIISGLGKSGSIKNSDEILAAVWLIAFLMYFEELNCSL